MSRFLEFARVLLVAPELVVAVLIALVASFWPDRVQAVAGPFLSLKLPEASAILGLPFLLSTLR